jgi:hypothetical protein
MRRISLSDESQIERADAEMYRDKAASRTKNSMRLE